MTIMGARVYNPATGRFTSTDPVAGGNANPYDYCSGDAIGCSDTSGLVSWCLSCRKTWFIRVDTVWTGGVDVNIRCGLSHAWVKTLFFVGGILGAVLGFILGVVLCAPGGPLSGVVCAFGGGALGVLIGTAVATIGPWWYDTFCDGSGGATARATFKVRWTHGFGSRWHWQWGYPLFPRCGT
jgi:hypothetical protein